MTTRPGAAPRRRRARSSAAARVRATLQAYADRGAFRSFSDGAPRAGKTRFRFTWYRDLSFAVAFDESSRTLTFERLLPAVPARSAMLRDLRAFIADRESRAVPEHRRIDRRKVRITAEARRGAASLQCRLAEAHVEYGVRKAVNIVHEIFTDFLSDGRFIAYQVEHLRLDPELA